MKEITKEIKEQVEKEVKSLLKSNRDELRQKGKNVEKVAFDHWTITYKKVVSIFDDLEKNDYGRFEAYDMPGTYYGFAQMEQNLEWWFYSLRQEVLANDGYDMNRTKIGGVIYSGPDCTKKINL